MNNPHRIRRLVLQGLCCVDSQGSSAWQSIEEFLRDSRETTMLIEQSLRTLRKAFDMRPQSDEMLLRNAGQWSLARLALIDRNILRLAVYELMEGTEEIKKMIKKEASTQDLFSQSAKDGMVTLIQEGIVKSLKGLTDAVEIRRVCSG